MEVDFEELCAVKAASGRKNSRVERLPLTSYKRRTWEEVLEEIEKKVGAARDPFQVIRVLFEACRVMGDLDGLLHIVHHLQNLPFAQGLDLLRYARTFNPALYRRGV